MGLAPFSAVVAQHGATVLRVCRSMLGPADADDAWSETFLAAMRAYPDLDDRANVAAWLTTIARRKAVDELRRRARAAARIGAITQITESIAGVPGPEPVDDELRAALGTLSERQQTAVVAHHVAGLPYTDVATLLDTTPAAARRSAADGIARLRAHYSKGPRP